MELKRGRRERRRTGSGTVFRFIEQQIKLYLDKVKDIVDYKNHPDFENIKKALNGVIPENEDDVVIVTNGVIWSYDLPLKRPTFVTVDFREIINRKAAIIAQASFGAGRAIQLEIECPGRL